MNRSLRGSLHHRAWSFVFVLLLALPAAAQFTTTGEILGRVTDEKGTPTAGATVTLQPKDGPAAETTTDANGFYRLVNITPGTYQLTIRRAGSTTLGPIPVVVTVGSRVKLDYQLTPMSGIAEEIVVNAPSPQLEVVKSSVDKYISQRAIQQLPLQNRTFIDVLTIVPGVETGVPTGTRAASGPKNSFNIHGGRSNENNFLIDGAPNNDKSDLNYENFDQVQGGPGSNTGAGPAGATFQVGSALQTFNIDAIQEVQVSTSLFAAEYGSGSGGVINVITRSGTDSLRGSATYQQQSDDYVKDPPQQFQRDQASLSLGGPIVRGRTHYFTTFEHDDHELGYDFNQPSFRVDPSLNELDLTANHTKRNRATSKMGGLARSVRHSRMGDHARIC